MCVMLDGIKSPNCGLYNLQVREIIQNLIDNYVQINKKNIRQNKAKLYKFWDTSLPCDNLISHARTIQDYFTKKSCPISEHKMVDTIYTVVF